MAFKPFYGLCKGPCGKDEQLIPVKDGFCIRCNHERKQEKKKAVGKKTGKYKYIKVASGELDVFEAKVNSLPDHETRCFRCEKRIAVLTPHNFAHVLAKGKYPLFRLNPENIVLLCHSFIADDEGNQGCHYSWDFKPRSELTADGWDKMFKLEAELKATYPNII